MSKGGINEFLSALFASEGGGKLDVENKFGYIGKYQFGEDALQDLGYYKGDSSSNRTISGKFKYDWSGDWTGKNGAVSKTAFLASAAIQDQAAKDWVALLCKRMKRFDLAKFIGETIGGVLVTDPGLSRPPTSKVSEAKNIQAWVNSCGVPAKSTARMHSALASLTTCASLPTTTLVAANTWP